MTKFTAKAGMTIRASTGVQGFGAADRMSTEFLSEAMPGDRLILLDKQYYFNVATYTKGVRDEWIYAFSYPPHQCWAAYNGDLSGQSYRQEDYIFSQNCYFMVCLKRVDGGEFEPFEAEKINEIIKLEVPPAQSRNSPFEIPQRYLSDECMTDGCEKLKAKIKKKKTGNSLCFALMADSHYTIGGTWEDTLASIKCMHGHIGFDGVIHLGDMTDGGVTAAATKKYAGKVIGDITSLNIPLYIAIGNHDTNYFRGNPEEFSVREQCELYLAHNDKNTVRAAAEPWYYKDFPEQKLRLCFLHSFDARRDLRYGFSPECINWQKEILKNTPVDYNIIIFSHLTLLDKLQYWAETIRGGKELAAMLNAYNDKSQPGKILAFINGHNHTDHIYNDFSFPIVSIGCAKPECFYENKPPGQFTPNRRLGDISQELWDAMVINPDEKSISFLRFGAGEDRFLY